MEWACRKYPERYVKLWLISIIFIAKLNSLYCYRLSAIIVRFVINQNRHL